MKNRKSDFGVFGLGVMGSSLSLNIADRGFELSVFNRTEGGEEQIVNNFMSENSTYKNIKGFTDLRSFITSLSRPRKILIMIKAGPAIDHLLQQIIPMLEHGDILIDGGNSHYSDTRRRFEFAMEKGIFFVGAGISGGEEGARRGPSIMPGGTRESYDQIAGVLEAVAAKDEFGKTCCTYIGPEGSGHFIKMVHNGIEYVEMQLLAELYFILSKSMSNNDIAKVFENWNKGELSSYLLEITIKILRKKEDDRYLLDIILDKAGNKGTGSWSSKAAFDMGMPNTMMAAAVFARYISSFKANRIDLSRLFDRNSKVQPVWDLSMLKKAYEFARLINHQQGFKLMRMASDSYGWGLDFSEIARIWSNGCIIKSQLMNQLHEEFRQFDDLFNMTAFTDKLSSGETSLRDMLKSTLDQRVSMHGFSTAYYYWIDMTTEKLPANLIQAQRDFFGAHTYQRCDASESEYFHSDWS